MSKEELQVPGPLTLRYEERLRLDVRKYTFTQRAFAVWNRLPENVVAATTIPCFESRLDRIWNNQAQKKILQ